MLEPKNASGNEVIAMNEILLRSFIANAVRGENKDGIKRCILHSASILIESVMPVGRLRAP